MMHVKQRIYIYIIIIIIIIIVIIIYIHIFIMKDHLESTKRQSLGHIFCIIAPHQTPIIKMWCAVPSWGFRRSSKALGWVWECQDIA